MSLERAFVDGDWFQRLREAEQASLPGRIGPYDLVAEVSRGGQGVVFRARQPGTHRDVALKRMIGGAFATAAAKARFEREIESISALSHPNIVTIFGVETIDAQPVLAMEWIEGVPIDDWAEDGTSGRRSVDEVLRAFLRVCEAVQHAHQRGVIHRDLKPTNILVDANDIPHVLDFGLAKSMNLDDSARARLTLTQEFLGTPAYASPEQLRADPSNIDARTDVYGLGAILYRLLAGQAPFETNQPLPALMEAIQTTQAAPPSRLNPRGNRELDAIVGMALAKEPTERYQSIDALGADVRRHLAGEPIVAHPPSAAYQLRKLVQRRPLPFAFAATVVLLVAAIGIVSTILALRLEQQRQEAVAAREEEVVARAAAESISRFLDSILAAASPATAQGDEPTVGELVDQAAARIDSELQDQPMVEATVRLTLGRTLYGLARYDEAENHLQRALQLAREHGRDGDTTAASALQNLGHVANDQSRYDEAASRYEGALEIWRAAPDRSLDVARTLRALATVRIEQNRIEAADALLAEAQALLAGQPDEDAEARLATRLHLAGLHFNAGRYEQAEQVLRIALEDSRALLGDRHKTTINALSNLALTLKRQNKLVEATELTEELLATLDLVYGADHLFTLQAMANYASLLQAKGENEQAEKAYRETLERLERAVGGDHGFSISAGNNLASLLQSQERYAEAEALYRTALERSRRVYGEEHPSTAIIMGQLGATLRDGRGEPAYAEAEELLRGTVAIFEAQLPPDHPHIAQSHAALEKLRDMVERE